MARVAAEAHRHRSLRRVLPKLVPLSSTHRPQPHQQNTTQTATMSAEKTDPTTHGSGSINDTWLNRLLVLAAIKILRRFRPRRGSILLLTDSVCIKYGPLHHLPEASTMEFIARNTSIPVPRIHCAFKRNGSTYIVMERIKGESIVYGWTSRSAESKTNIL